MRIWPIARLTKRAAPLINLSVSQHLTNCAIFGQSRSVGLLTIGLGLGLWLGCAIGQMRSAFGQNGLKAHAPLPVKLNMLILVTARCRAKRERWWVCARSSSADSNNFVVKVSMICRVTEADRDPAIHRRTATDDTGVTGQRRRVQSSTCVVFAEVS